MKNSNKLLEYAKVFGNNYGTPIESIKTKIKSKKDVLFDIDWQGSRKIKKKLGKDVVSIFILPPSKKELIRRLKKRAQDPAHIVKQRLSFYKKELSHWREYKYVLINKNLTETVKKIKSILEAERIINQKQTLILKKVRSL
jgi:guanylate kinase